jgi:hypothetical protein
MHALTVYLLYLGQALALSIGDITPEDHGKTVLFRRYRQIGPVKVPYFHKGIIVYPSTCEIGGVSKHNALNITSDFPHVVHLYGQSKRHAKVRIDPMEEIIGEHSFEVLSDTDSCFKKDECIDRALCEVGGDHRGVSYNLIANNCGNFVAWAKYGSSDADTQVRDFIKKLPVLKYPLYAIQKRFKSVVEKRGMELVVSNDN